MHGRRLLEAGVLLGAMATGAALLQVQRAHACDCVWWVSEELPLALVASKVDGVAQPLPVPVPSQTGVRADPGTGRGTTVLRAVLYDAVSPAALRCVSVEAQP